MTHLASLQALLWHMIDKTLQFGLPVQAFSYVLLPFGAAIAFRQQQAREDIGHGMRAFLRYCFSFETNLGWSEKFRSLKLDIGFVIIKKFVTDWVLVPILLSSGLAATAAYHALATVFGAQTQVSPGWILGGCMIAIGVVVSDFMQFIIHWYHHRNLTLWDVHKVHHSTEFMVFSFSTKRTHVIEEIINLTITNVTVGVVIGVLSYLLKVEIWDSLIYGVDAWFMVQLLSFWHLRHTHMSLSYGWLEHILQSPAQHHLHHSSEKRHRGKNFAMVFSFWDKMTGSFERSVDPRSYRLGLAERDRGNYDTVLKLYLTPIKMPVKRMSAVARKRLPAVMETLSHLRHTTPNSHPNG